MRAIAIGTSDTRSDEDLLICSWYRFLGECRRAIKMIRSQTDSPQRKNKKNQMLCVG